MKENKFIIKNEFSNANIARTIRFTEIIFERLNQISVDKKISFNLLILQCCKYALDNLDDKSILEICFLNNKKENENG